MRFATPGFPNPCSSCVIAAVTGTSYVDSSPNPPPGSFPPAGKNPVQAAAGTISLDNVDYTSPGLLFNVFGVTYPFGLVPTNAVAGDCVIFSANPPFLADGALDCHGSGGAVTGSGTVGVVPLWTTTTTNLGNSHLSDNGSLVTSSENVAVTPLGGSGTKCVHVSNTGQFGLAAADCGSGSGSVTGSGTINNLPKWTGSTALGNADLTDDGSFTAANAEPFSFRTEPGMQQFANDTSTGTVVNTLTKIIANGTASAAIQATTSDTKNIIGICTVACGTSGNAQVSFLGQALCVMDGSNLVRDYVQVSTTTAGDCTDAGNVEPSNGKQTLGRIVTPSGGAGLAAVVDLYSPDTASHSGGSISFNPSPPTANAIVTAVSATQIQTPNAGLLADSSGDVTTPGNYTGAQLTTTGQATIEGNLNAQQTSNFGQPGQSASIGLYTADNNEVVWQTGATGVNATETWTANPTGNGQVPTSSSCSGNSCNITWAAPAGGVTSVAAGAGLSASPSPITSTGTISCQTSTASQIGCAEPDNSTIKATAGVYAAQSTTINGVTCTPGSTCTVVTTNQNIRTVGATFGDFSSGATALSASSIACVSSYWAGTITAVELIGTPSGSVTVDVRKVAHASFTGPASTSSITASDIPALSSATTYTDTTLTGWTTSVSAGTDFCFYLTSPTTVTGVSISVKVAAN